MSSKVPDPGPYDNDNHEYGDDLPPPYSPSAGNSIFAPQLRSLHLPQDQLPLYRQDQAGDTEDHVHQILSGLVDPIEAFIASVFEMRPAPRMVEGALVPADALGPKWTLTDQGERESGEYRQVIRVQRKALQGGMSGKDDRASGTGGSNGHGSGSGSSEPREQRGFADWGRWDDEASSDPDPETALWWSDEDMAKRLARQLQNTMLSQPVKQAGSPGRTWSVLSRAEEVTFRRENEMGIWESKTGWGIVVHLTPRR